MLDSMQEILRKILVDPASAGAAVRLLYLTALVLLAGASYVLLSGFILRRARGLIEKSRRDWLDMVFNVRMLRIIAAMAPLFVIYRGVGVVFAGIEGVAQFLERLSLALLTVLALATLANVSNAADKIYQRFPFARERPIKGILQLLLIFIFGIGAVYIIAMMMGKPAWGMISGIGALSAVLLLVFKDTLLGIAASFQIGANNMVAIGDWIEMPKYNADGDVIDISLQTIKVRNWDKTITTIPIYALVSDSFKNWRGMFETGGRRIMRPIYIDMRSIRFCDSEMIERFRKMHYLRDYVDAKMLELERHNREHEIDDSIEANGRRMTNIGTYRAYMTEYLNKHPGLRKNMMLMVRQLDPGPTGLPLQVWAFTATTVWTEYEGIQSDIFDHLLAVLPTFNLRPFQNPSGWDIETIGKNTQ